MGGIWGARNKASGGGGPTSLLFVGGFETFAELETALGAAPDFAVGFVVTGTGLVGVWTVVSGVLFLLGEVYLWNASSGTFRPGTDYVLHGPLGATWENPGPGGGLTLDTNGVISWPCLGIYHGQRPRAFDVRGHYTIGTQTNPQRMGAGWMSLAGGAGKGGYRCQGPYRSTTADIWYQTYLQGDVSPLTETFFATTSSSFRVCTATAPILSDVILSGATMAPRGDLSTGYSFGGMTRTDALNPGSAAPNDGNSLNLYADSDDSRPCVAFNDAGSGDSTLRLQTMRVVGGRT
jgi:hypothetical protein